MGNEGLMPIEPFAFLELNIIIYFGKYHFRGSSGCWFHLMEEIVTYKKFNGRNSWIKYVVKIWGALWWSITLYGSR